jgi:hypothetical protein
LACNDFGGTVAALYINHSPEEWRLFIDSTKLSLKAVLLHYSNMMPSNSSWPCSQYGDMKLLNCINYKKYQWKLYRDLKVVAVLLGLQQGYTKVCCFLCERASRAKTSLYKKRS